MRYPRHARIFRGHLDAAPFVGVLFLVAIFLLLNSSFVFLPGVAIRLPEGPELPGVAGPTLTVAVDTNGRLYFRNQVTSEADLENRLRVAARETRETPVLVLVADKAVAYDTIVRLTRLARVAGLKQALLTTSPAPPPARSHAAR